MLKFIDDMYLGINKRTGFMKHYYALWAIVEGLEAKNTFEFGTGMSTWVICSASYGQHTSCDVRNIIDTGLPTHFGDMFPGWTFLQADSRQVVFDVVEPLDFVLHDGSHEPDIVRQDIINILPKMKQNSILMVHDTESINYGTSLKEASVDALGTLAHERVTLPYAYGLTIIRILGNKDVGIVNPTWTKA